MRSLVPMVRKSASRASRSAVYAARRHFDHRADRHSLESASLMPSSAAASRTSRRASRISSTADTNGNMMRSAPCVEARSSARSWRRNGSGFSRLEAAGRACPPPSSSRSNVRIVDGARRHAFDHAAVDAVLLFFVGARGAPRAHAAHEQELRPVQADAFGARVARGREVVGEFDVRVESNPHAVGGRLQVRPARPASRPPAPPSST